MVKPGALSDDPRDGTPSQPDLLNRQEYIESIAALLESVREQSESSVLALIGDWGSGKTSVLEMLRVSLESTSKPWSVGTFNPWAYPDSDSIQAGFFVELYNALPEDAHQSDLKEKVAKVARRLSPLGALAGVAGVDGRRLIEEGADLIGGAESLDASMKAAADDLRRIAKPVLIVMDDLDRLTPDELLTVLKLVRLIGRLPHVYYLLGYDEHTLVDVLSSTPLVGNPERAQAYLEKVVQIRLDMPMLRSAERLALLGNGLDQVCAAAEVTLTDDDAQRIVRIYESALESRLTTPRAIGRFLGQVQALYPPLRDEVDFVDFFLISWLRTIEPSVYRMVQRDSTALLGGTLTSWGLQKDPAAAESRQAHWRERLRAANVPVENEGSVVAVLGDLFPEMQAAFASTGKWEEARKRSTRKAISDPNYFERYMVFGVPDDDLRDSVVATAVRDLEENRESDAVSTLRTAIISRTELVMSKIRSLRRASDSVPNLALAEFLLDAEPDVAQRASLLSDSPVRAIERELARCLARMDAAQATKLAERVSISESGTRIVNSIRELYWDGQRDAQLQPQGAVDLDGVFDVARRALGAEFGSRTAPDPLSVSEVMAFLAWSDLDRESAIDWVGRQIAEGVWSPVVAAVSLVIPSQGNSGSGVEYFCGGLLSEILTASLPIADLVEALRDVVVEDIPFHSSYEYTPAGRMQCATAELRRISGNRS